MLVDEPGKRVNAFREKVARETRKWPPSRLRLARFIVILTRTCLLGENSSCFVRRGIVLSSALRLFLGMLRFLRRKNFEFEIFRLFDSGRSRSFLDRSKRRGIGSVKCFTTRANTSRLLSWPRPSRISIPKRRKEGRKESRALCLRGMMHRSTNSG